MHFFINERHAFLNRLPHETNIFFRSSVVGCIRENFSHQAKLKHHLRHDRIVFCLVNILVDICPTHPA
jgi:hypothetical protein